MHQEQKGVQHQNTLGHGRLVCGSESLLQNGTIEDCTQALALIAGLTADTYLLIWPMTLTPFKEHKKIRYRGCHSSQK